LFRVDVGTDVFTVILISVVIGLYVLANFGERQRVPRILAIVGGAILAALAMLYGIAAIAVNNGAVVGVTRVGGYALLAVGALSLLYLLPSVQQAVGRLTRLTPGSPVMYLTVVIGLILVATQLGSQLERAPSPLTYGDLLSQDIPLLVLAFVGVGIFIRRTPPEAMDRLGLEPPVSGRWWWVATVGIGAFIAIAFGIESIANIVAPHQQKQVTDVSNVLFSHFNNPAAIIFLGVLAGVVEETLFRGALLPRVGIVISAILFAALHTQYAISFATLEVLVLGLALGWLRVKSGSTLPCMVTHAGYDIAVGLIPFVFK
jgi:membrane protease YdiL (CAAX protease family)